jgi:hypothetical protein
MFVGLVCLVQTHANPVVLIPELGYFSPSVSNRARHLNKDKGRFKCTFRKPVIIVGS